MDNTADVAEVLFGRLDTLVLSPPLPVDYPEPERVFVPPADGKYLVAQFLPNAHRWSDMKGSSRMGQGFLQVTVVWPKNKGVIDPLALGGEVADHFTGFSSGSVKVSGPPVVAQPIPDVVSVSVPVTIPWTAA